MVLRRMGLFSIPNLDCFCFCYLFSVVGVWFGLIWVGSVSVLE